MAYDFYYGDEAEQFSFYRIPKQLITDKRFKNLSCEAKLLYGLMLDRMGLSIKNGWVDENNRVFIIFTLEDAIACMNCGKDKGTSMFKELEQKAGLIQRKRQGLGKPALIYVKNFVKPITQDPSPPPEKAPENRHETSPTDTGAESRNPDSGKPEVKTPEKPESGLKFFRTTDCGKSGANNTNMNKTDLRDTENLSINPDGNDGYNAYLEIVRGNIDYEYLTERIGKDRVDNIVSIIMDVLSTKQEHFKIGDAVYPADVVKSRMLKLDMLHIEYVFFCLDKATTDIQNIRAYIIACLYNAPATMDQYFSSMYNHNRAKGFP